ncbi:MAG: hypothetical protein ABL921_12830, partial [Pirellula sp.]
HGTATELLGSGEMCQKRHSCRLLWPQSSLKHLEILGSVAGVVENDLFRIPLLTSARPLHIVS